MDWEKIMIKKNYDKQGIEVKNIKIEKWNMELFFSDLRRTLIADFRWHV